MKSFIPWVGGKTLLAKKIIGEFPETFGRYIDLNLRKILLIMFLCDNFSFNNICFFTVIKISRL